MVSAIVESAGNDKKKQHRRDTQITHVEAVMQGQCSHCVEGDAAWLA